MELGRTLFGIRLLCLNMLTHMAGGLQGMLLRLTVLAYGSISEENGGILLDICTLKLEMAQRSNFGLTLGVGHAISRIFILSYFAL